MCKRRYFPINNPPLVPNDGASRLIERSHHQALYQTNLKMIDSLICISLISVILRYLTGQKRGERMTENGPAIKL